MWHAFANQNVAVADIGVGLTAMVVMSIVHMAVGIMVMLMLMMIVFADVVFADDCRTWHVRLVYTVLENWYAKMKKKGESVCAVLAQTPVIACAFVFVVVFVAAVLAFAVCVMC